ncbi:hypothetical protein GGR92_005261 [Spirosoma lacussanchae]|uniref:hypothetical protein n=1 Tax=Spirosoma lacussanchae TaxID=1884249 RepID=UPI0011086AB5|nr:hypothetical protein [Spirosoma lacussanchae]
MILSDDDALSLLSSPKNKPQLAEAIAWQERVQFHGLTVRNRLDSRYFETYLKWVFGFLQATDKQAAFRARFPFPVPTTKLLSEVQDGWMKLFDAVNPSLVIQGRDGIDAELIEYLQTSGEVMFWPDEAIAALVESHNDILVVDIKPGDDGLPAPYLTRVNLTAIQSIELRDDGTCEHIAYKTADGRMIVIDDNAYRVYSKAAESDNWTVEVFPHYLGRCPARMLWDERVKDHAVASHSLIDEVLSDLEDYCFWHVAYDLFKLYGAFPIYWTTASTSEAATSAPYQPRNADGTPDAGYPDNCQKPETPAASSWVGPGDVYELPPGTDQIVAPVGIVEPSTDSLTFQDENRDKMYRQLVQYLTGAGGESALMDKAVNEKQATGTFASKENVLRYISRHLSAARQWGVLTIGQLRYGISAVVSVAHSFGTEFYLQTEAEMWDGLASAKQAGAPQTILLEKVERIQAFRLRSGGDATRSQILLDLEPMPEMSLSDAKGLLMMGLTSQQDVAVKAQFNQLIKQCEREFGADIVEIGSALPYSQKIERIKTYLYNNVKTEQPRPTATDSAGRTSSTEPASAV